MLTSRTSLILFLCLLLSSAASSQFSSSGKISLLTVAHGEDAYNIFGHTAIRAYDRTTGLNEVYNYGTFDSHMDNFILKFLRGKLEYQLAIQPYDSFLQVYHQEGRAIKEQELDLDDITKEKVYNYLRTNYKPENRFYLYDFFFDNCSTRVRDLFETQLAGFEITKELNAQPVTYRNLLDEYLQGLDWTDFGIDLIIGSVADADADYRHQTFLPDYLHDWADQVSYFSEDQTVALVKEENKVLLLELKKHTSYLITPLLFFSFLAFVELLLFLFRSKISNFKSLIKSYDVFCYLAISVTSIVVMLMWFMTDHQACGDNYNLMWANPLFLVVLFGQFWKKWTMKALMLTSLFLVMTILLWALIPQQYHIAVIPIIVLFVFKNLRQMAQMMKLQPSA